MKGEDQRLPPVENSFGPFIFTGNSNPEIRYITFDDELMEFVYMIVRLNLPNRISFSAATDDLGTVKVKPRYQHPFYALAYQIYRYFPLTPNTARNENVQHKG